MKKLWIITLLFFYLGSISGMTIHTHYLCCQSKAVHIKPADRHESAYDLKIQGPAFKYTDLFIRIPVSKNPTQGLPINRVVVVYEPPVRSAPLIYLSNCVLIM